MKSAILCSFRLIRVCVVWLAVTLGFAQDAMEERDRAIPQAAVSPAPITAEGRLKWFADAIAPASLAGGVISAGWGTLFNRPREYGTRWDGFGARYGMRLSGVVTGNAIEAALGALWNEDSRYPRAAGRPFKARLAQVVKMTFLAQNSEGRTVPAYARYSAIAGNNFLSNTWRERSEADTSHALERIALGFVGRLSGNAFKEFWPDVRRTFPRKP